MITSITSTTVCISVVETVKAGTVAVGAVHLSRGSLVLAKGSMAFYTPSGVVVRDAPWCEVTEPLTKRVMYAITDCVLVAILETRRLHQRMWSLLIQLRITVCLSGTSMNLKEDKHDILDSSAQDWP